jgi:hypothetical protein
MRAIKVTASVLLSGKLANSLHGFPYSAVKLS